VSTIRGSEYRCGESGASSYVLRLGRRPLSSRNEPTATSKIRRIEDPKEERHAEGCRTARCAVERGNDPKTQALVAHLKCLRLGMVASLARRPDGPASCSPVSPEAWREGRRPNRSGYYGTFAAIPPDSLRIFGSSILRRGRGPVQLGRGTPY